MSRLGNISALPPEMQKTIRRIDEILNTFENTSAQVFQSGQIVARNLATFEEDLQIRGNLLFDTGSPLIRGFVDGEGSVGSAQGIVIRSGKTISGSADASIEWQLSDGTRRLFMDSAGTILIGELSPAPVLVDGGIARFQILRISNDPVFDSGSIQFGPDADGFPGLTTSYVRALFADGLNSNKLSVFDGTSNISLEEQGHTIQQDAVGLTQRGNLDFQDHFVLVDNAGSDATEVTFVAGNVITTHTPLQIKGLSSGGPAARRGGELDFSDGAGASTVFVWNSTGDFVFSNVAQAGSADLGNASLDAATGIFTLKGVTLGDSEPINLGDVGDLVISHDGTDNVFTSNIPEGTDSQAGFIFEWDIDTDTADILGSGANRPDTAQSNFRVTHTDSLGARTIGLRAFPNVQGPILVGPALVFDDTEDWWLGGYDAGAVTYTGMQKRAAALSFYFQNNGSTPSFDVIGTGMALGSTLNRVEIRTTTSGKNMRFFPSVDNIANSEWFQFRNRFDVDSPAAGAAFVSFQHSRSPGAGGDIFLGRIWPGANGGYGVSDGFRISVNDGATTQGTSYLHNNSGPEIVAAGTIAWQSDSSLNNNELGMTRTEESGITASTTQTQGNGPLTADVNEVSTVANTGDTVTLPAATAGRICVIIQNGALAMNVFPASGDDLGAGTNNQITGGLLATEMITFRCYDANNWRGVVGTKVN